jgi:hypothetical protein
LLIITRKNLGSVEFSEGIVRRINKRMKKLDETSFSGLPIFN